MAKDGQDDHKMSQDGHKDGQDGYMDCLDRVSPLLVNVIVSLLVNIWVTVSLLVNV